MRRQHIGKAEKVTDIPSDGGEDEGGCVLENWKEFRESLQLL